MSTGSSTPTWPQDHLPFEIEPSGPADDDRHLLLELALELQRWPVRNTVFREALDRVASDLAQMASKARAS
jgi:hypothetical protein